MKTYCPEGWLIDTADNTAATASVTSLNEAMERGRILEAKALVCDYEHNLIVDLGGVKGIIPRTEGAIGVAEGDVRDIALISRVNKPVCFKVREISRGSSGFTAVLSRKDAQLECRRDYISALRPGDVVNARVTHLENFGAFCDIGCGVIALMPIDAISVSRISHPRDRFETGDDILAVVRGIDSSGRVTLSHRELLGTWQENADNFAQGETVSGIIRSVEDYGIFVELTPNLAGLAEPRPDVRVGQFASVFIKSLIPEKMKVKLIIIDSFDADYKPDPFRYYFSGDRMTDWRYSPPDCPKIIESVFI